MSGMGGGNAIINQLGMHVNFVGDYMVGTEVEAGRRPMSMMNGMCGGNIVTQMCQTVAQSLTSFLHSMGQQPVGSNTHVMNGMGQRPMCGNTHVMNGMGQQMNSGNQHNPHMMNQQMYGQQQPHGLHGRSRSCVGLLWCAVCMITTPHVLLRGGGLRVEPDPPLPPLPLISQSECLQFWGVLAPRALLPFSKSRFTHAPDAQ